MLKVVEPLPFAVGRAPPVETAHYPLQQNIIFCGARREAPSAAPRTKPFKKFAPIISAAGENFFGGFQSFSGF